MAYERKTIDTWELQLNYGYGWEYTLTEYTRKEAREFGEEIDTVDLELADGKKITAPAVVDVSALGCMDELEYELWHVIEDYMVQFGIRTQDDEPDWATVKAVQESILTAFTDAGVNFKFLSDEKLREIEKAIKKKESESWAAKRKKNR